MELMLQASTFDVTRLSSLSDISTKVEAIVSKCSSDLLLLPELLWLPGFPDPIKDEPGARRTAEELWSKVLPSLARKSSTLDRFFVLGTAPFWKESQNAFSNRAVVVQDGELLYQDKLCLTPWEVGLVPGEDLKVFNFRGQRLAIAVCFDIEMPEIAARLKLEGVNCVLVPSATETRLGWERIQRCASARSVELCAYVATAHLLGRSECELVSENEGSTSVFAPAQSPFLEQERQSTTVCRQSGFFDQIVTLDFSKVVQARGGKEETNPFKAKPL